MEKKNFKLNDTIKCLVSFKINNSFFPEGTLFKINSTELLQYIIYYHKLFVIVKSVEERSFGCRPLSNVYKGQRPIPFC